MSTKFNLKSVLIALCGLLLIYGSYHLLYLKKVLPQVYLADLNLSGKRSVDLESMVGGKLESFGKSPLIFTIEGKMIESNLDTLGVTFDTKQTSSSVFQIGRSGRLTDDLAVGILAIFRRRQVTSVFSLNPTKFSQTIDGLVSSYEKKPAEATIVYDGGQYKIKDGIMGLVVDRSLLISQLQANLASLESRPINLQLIEAKPKISADNAQEALLAINFLGGKRVTLIYERNVWSLSGQELIDLVTLLPSGRQEGYLGIVKHDENPLIIKDVRLIDSPQQKLVATLDRRKLEAFIGEIAQSIDRQATDATLKFEGGKVRAFTPARDGLRLEVGKTREEILEKIESSSPPLAKEIVINLPVVVTAAKIASTEINSLGIKESVGRGESYFGGSIANRIHNIRLGSSQINGMLLAPGEVFSFNETVGEVSAATGYKQAYVISKGRTVLDDGGGICQVSTTLFRAVLNAGLPVAARTAHAYRVGYYEQRGFAPGFDATVWAPAVDFAFKNDTANHLLIQAVVEPAASKLEVDIYGTRDGRKVDISNLVVANRKPAPPPLYQDDPTLPKGTTKQVDFEAEGATAVFSRKVVKGDKILIDESFKSFYRPWQAVYLVGTGG